MKSKAVVKVMPPQRSTKLAENIREVLKDLGENASREGLERTPERYEKALRFLTSGYTTSLEEIVNHAIFQEKCDEMVIVKDIEFFSMCEHHLLPFFGKVHVAYLPKDKVIGLSKIPRIINMFARRLQLQERLTHQIADEIQRVTASNDVMVVGKGQHLCMSMRGIKTEANMSNSVVRGKFRELPALRAEALSLMRSS